MNIHPEKTSFITQNTSKINDKLDHRIISLVNNQVEFIANQDSTPDPFLFIDDKVQLQIYLTNNNDISLLKQLYDTILIESKYENTIQALVPVSTIQCLAEEPFIQYITKPQRVHPTTIISEGVATINASALHNLGYYGDEIHAAIIDVGFKNFNTNSEIPLSQITETKSFRTDNKIDMSKHGTACAELLFDVAPHINLSLYAVETNFDLYDAIMYAINQSIQIISISLSIFNQNDLDGTGMLCEAINTARAANVLVCVSAGNQAEQHYTGWYISNDNNSYHDFDTLNNNLTIGTELGYIPKNHLIDLWLSWNDWPASDQDYDLYLIDSIGNYIAYSNNNQNGTQPPIEQIQILAPKNDIYHVQIDNYSATASVRFQLFSVSCLFLDNNHPETSICCPADATGAFAVGASYWQNDFLEPYSAQGPTNDNRAKPDVIAPDGVSTSTFGFRNFSGTSAATPHVTGAAALLKNADTTLSANQLQIILETTAIDYGDPGKDNQYGSGRIDLLNAYNSPLVNKPPTANNDSYQTNEDTLLIIPTPGVLSNDTDPNNDTLTAIKKSNTTHGTLTTFTSTGSFSYTPHLNYYGQDSFIYIATDGNTNSQPATVFITILSVNDPPVANDDTATVLEDSTLNQINVLNNDTDIDNDQLYISNVTSPSHGTIAFNITQTAIYYIPTPNYFGTDQFTYTANDGNNGTDTATVTITVVPVNDPPIANDDTTTLAEDTINHQIMVLTNDNDIDGDTLTIIGVTAPVHGTATNHASYIRYTPAQNYHGPDTLTYTISDNHGGTDSATIDITITPVNDQPTANFTIWPSTTTYQQPVYFNSTSFDPDNDIINWTWDFNDGKKAYQKNTTHQFQYSGYYNITLTIRDQNNTSDTKILPLHIINIPPTADFTYTPQIPLINTPTSFTDSSSDSDGNIQTWFWDFDNETTSRQQNPQHSFTEFKTHTVTLTVTDNGGDSNTTSTQIITKKINTNLVGAGQTTINLTDQMDTKIILNTTAPITVTTQYFSGNPTGIGLSNNLKSLGKYLDITLDNLSRVVWPIHVEQYYTQDDLYNIPCSETQLFGLYFFNQTNSLWKIYNRTGINTSYQNNGYIGYYWADTWHLTTITPAVDIQPPTKVLNLRISDAHDGKLNLRWNPATDNLAVTGYKIYRDTQFIVQVDTTSFIDSGLINYQSYTYQVSAIDYVANEGQKSDSKNGVSTPASSNGGGSSGSSGTYDPSSEPDNEKPIANLSAGEPYQGHVNQPITFDGSASDDPDGNIIQWFWFFGDGTNGSGKKIQHSYVKPGEYQVSLTVWDDNDDEDTDTTTVIVIQPNRPPSQPEILGRIIGTKNTDYNYQIRSFDADNDTLTYTIHWGDTTSFSSQPLANGTFCNVTHLWVNPDVYMLQIEVSDNQTTTTAETTIYIDAVSVGKLGYLIDTDADAIYDSFYSNQTKSYTKSQQQDEWYLIDTDNDSKWDWLFSETQGLNMYTGSQTPGFQIEIVLCALVIIIVIFRKKRC